MFCALIILRLTKCRNTGKLIRLLRKTDIVENETVSEKVAQFLGGAR